MPLTVITLKNAPDSLRGDLTKWMQEIATGVYVGNFNSKIREALWNRICESINGGEATLSYSFRNEIGYEFDTYNTNRFPIDYDGIPLVLIPKKDKDTVDYQNNNFSDASKYHIAKKFTGIKSKVDKGLAYVVIDIETDGMDPIYNEIIEIGAIKVVDEDTFEFSSLIKINKKLKKEIIDLTGINDKLLIENGRDFSLVVSEFLDFIGDLPIVGYNINFDITFLNNNIKKLNYQNINNPIFDLLPYVKKEKPFINNYRLENVIKEYNIENEEPHRALADAKATYGLSKKLTKFLININKGS